MNHQFDRVAMHAVRRKLLGLQASLRVGRRSARGGGQSGESRGRAIPTSGLGRDETEFAEPGGGAVLQQAGGEDDAAELPPVPVD